MFKPESVATTLSLSMLVALGPLSTDMYLPALPTMAVEFASSSGPIQLTLSLYLAGFALAQIIYGPLSDRFGRKPVMLAGMAIFIVASVGCILSTQVGSLIVMRFLQAAGGAAGPVLARAMVRDIHGTQQSGRVMAQVAAVMALAPTVAPVAGGLLLAYAGWRSIFVFLVFYAVGATLLLALKIAESAPAATRRVRPLSQLPSAYRRLLTDREFVGYTLACSLSFSGVFAFISGSSFVVIEFYGMSPVVYGLLFGLNVLGFISGTTYASRTSNRLGVQRLVRLGALICLIASGLLLVGLSAPTHIAMTLAPMMLFMAGAGLVMPQSMAGALMHHPQLAGTASGLVGFIQMTVAGLVGVAVGHGHDGSPLVMTLAVSLCGTLTWVVYRYWID